jgi:hypothetical protein
MYIQYGYNIVMKRKFNSSYDVYAEASICHRMRIIQYNTIQFNSTQVNQTRLCDVTNFNNSTLHTENVETIKTYPSEVSANGTCIILN